MRIINRENVMRWVEALESGEYTQTIGVLHRLNASGAAPVGYCCLGVGCVVAGIPERHRPFDNVGVFGDGADTWAPMELLEWAGISDAYADNLADLNDGGVPFPEIAVRLRDLLDEAVPS